MTQYLTDPVLAALAGIVGGVMLGLAARLGRFCTLGAIEDHLYGGSNQRLMMWAIAIGTAVMGSFGLMAAGYFDPNQSMYMTFAWDPFASIAGGLMFGYGMALCGNCGFGAIARLGGGDLRSFVIVLVMGIGCYVALSGPLAFVRIWLFPQETVTGDVPGFAQLISSAIGLSTPMIGVIIGAAIFAIGLASGDLRRSPKSIFWGVIVGLAIVTGWAGSSYVNRIGFDDLPVVSHSFSAPVGETILFAMTGSARPLSFAVGSVFGVWLGALIGSIRRGHFRWEACEDPRELRRQIIGAGIMGVGAVIAMGCTVGQGISAFSVLAYSAPVTFAAIYLGAWLGLKQLIEGFSVAED